MINVICERFKALLKSLNILKDSSDRITASNANIFKNIISSFSFVLTLLFLKKIFLITTPLSNYLQSKSLDFIEALRLVNYAKTQLENFRCDEEYEKLVTESNQFCLAHDLHENNFKERRTRKKKRMVEENTEDEVLNSAFINYKINTYFKVLDNIVISFTTRFNSAQEILKDLSLLSPERLIEFANDKEQKLPNDSFVYISQWIQGISLESLRNEHNVFSGSFLSLLNGSQIPKNLHESDTIQNSEIEEESNGSGDEDEEQEVEHSNGKYNNITASTILHILNSFDLISAFPNIFLAYKALATIPASSASAERNFSKVHF